MCSLMVTATGSEVGAEAHEREEIDQFGQGSGLASFLARKLSGLVLAIEQFLEAIVERRGQPKIPPIFRQVQLNEHGLSHGTSSISRLAPDRDGYNHKSILLSGVFPGTDLLETTGVVGGLVRGAKRPLHVRSAQKKTHGKDGQRECMGIEP